MKGDRTAGSTTARERGLLLCGVVGPLLAPVPVGLFGGGLMGAGIFAIDPVAAGVTAAAAYPLGAAVTADRTVPGVLHDLFGVPAFVGLPIACGVVAYRMAVAGRRGWAAYSAATAVAFSACFVLSAMALRQPPLIAPVGGLLQRVTIVLGRTWLAALAYSLPRGDGGRWLPLLHTGT